MWKRQQSIHIFVEDIIPNCVSLVLSSHHFSFSEWFPSFPSLLFFSARNQTFSLSKHFPHFLSPFFFSWSDQVFSLSKYLCPLPFSVFLLLWRPNIFVLQIFPPFLLCSSSPPLTKYFPLFPSPWRESSLTRSTFNLYLSYAGTFLMAESTYSVW